MTKLKTKVFSTKKSNGIKLIISRREICPSHKPLLLGYAEWQEEAELRKGMKQKKCEVCKRWLWKDEM